jgi:2-oxoglutarate dehydrogenase E1 component
MDRFSFLNAAHTAFFADLYDQYLQNPDSVEPSWRSFFQGFDFANEFPNTGEQIAHTANGNVSGGNSEKLQKEFTK